jgi:hypothetical protein
MEGMCISCSRHCLFTEPYPPWCPYGWHKECIVEDKGNDGNQYRIPENCTEKTFKQCMVDMEHGELMLCNNCPFTK